MTNDNQDALRCAEAIDSTHWPEREVAAHIRRLVAENEQKESALKIVEATCDDFANQIEAKDALLRQAVEALKTGQIRAVSEWEVRDVTPKIVRAAIAAIRQHLETNK